MRERINHIMDMTAEFISQRKGLLPLLGLLLVLANALLQFLATGWLAETNLLLHLGVILAILGFLLAWAL